MELYLMVAVSVSTLIAAVMSARTAAKKAEFDLLEARVVILEMEVQACRRENTQYQHDIKVLQAENLGLLQRIVQDGGRVAAVKTPAGSGT